MRKSLWLVLSSLILAALVVAGCAGEPAAAGEPEQEPVDPEDAEILVDSVDILILESFPVQVNAIVKGSLHDACVEIEHPIVEREGSTFTITFETERMIDALCAPGRAPFEQTVSLDVLGLSAGSYTVNAGEVTATFELAVDNVLPEE